MANEWKCSRCSTVNDVSSVTCASCGLMRGSAVLPGASDAPRSTESTSSPPGSTAPEDQPDSGWDPSTTESTPPSEPGWAALRTDPAQLPPTDPVGDAPPTTGWAAPVGTPAAAAAAPAVEPVPPAAPVPLWRRIPIGGLLFLVLVVGGGIASWYFSADRSETGEITGAGDLQATDLRVGDCFDLKEPEATEIGDVTATPCTQEHEYELFYQASLPEGDYPAETAFEQYVKDNCLTTFSTYVGKAFEESELDIYWLYPTDDAWRDGDRSVQCAVYHPRVARLTTSLKDSKR